MRGRWSELTLPEAWRLLKWRLISFGPRRDVTVETANGRLTLDSGDWAIGKQLYVKRQYESLETQRATSVLKRAGFLPESPDTLLDIGANVGMICIGLVRGIQARPGLRAFSGHFPIADPQR